MNREKKPTQILSVIVILFGIGAGVLTPLSSFAQIKKCWTSGLKS
jgi:hypothetical protein